VTWLILDEQLIGSGEERQSKAVVGAHVQAKRHERNGGQHHDHSEGDEGAQFRSAGFGLGFQLLACRPLVRAFG
jgi:hypothetical protein